MRLSAGRRKSIYSAQRRFVTVWLVPALLFFAYFRVYPLLQSLYMSVFRWDLLRPVKPYVGLANYKNALQDPLFIRSMLNTFYYAAAVTVGGITAALVFALCMHVIKRLSTVFRVIYFMPNMTSAVAVATVWLWLYQPRFGLFNYILESFGLKGIGWLESVTWAMPSLILMSIWSGVGFTVVILLAGLKDIPPTLYEAASIDGGSGWQVFRFITLPLLTPVLTFVFVTGVITAFRVFDSVYVMTQGGPLNATRVIAYHVYFEAFERLRMGSASAMAFLLFLVVFVLTMIQLRMGRVKWQM